MHQDKYLEDLKEIKEMMSRSSRFISLSGLSGVAAGVSALLGAYLAYQAVYVEAYTEYGRLAFTTAQMMRLVYIACGTLVLALGSGIFFTTRETRKRGETFWDYRVKRLLVNLAIPLVTGGTVCLMLLLRGYAGLVAPLTLVFYGLALVHVSKYTLGEIRSLGLLEIVLGLIALQFPGYGLYFWAVGFGLLHIAYGIYIPLKERS